MDWEDARQGKLYSILPARGSEIIVVGSDRVVLQHCHDSLSESGYMFPHGIWLLPGLEDVIPGGDYASSIISTNQISRAEEVALVRRVLWSPSPVILRSFPLIAQNICCGACQPHLSMLDIGAGSGRDAVWPLTCASPLRDSIAVVVALDRTRQMLERAAVLADMNGVQNAWGGEEPPPNRSSSVPGVPRQSGQVLLVMGDATVDGILDQVSANANRTAHPPSSGFDIVHVARYLNRAIFPAIRSVLNPGGFVIYHHFLVGSYRPKDEAQLLAHGELADVFGPQHGFLVEIDDVLVIADGRPTSIFCARKL